MQQTPAIRLKIVVQTETDGIDFRMYSQRPFKWYLTRLPKLKINYWLLGLILTKPWWFLFSGQGFGILIWKHVGTQKISSQSSKLVVSCRTLYIYMPPRRTGMNNEDFHSRPHYYLYSTGKWLTDASNLSFCSALPIIRSWTGFTCNAHGPLCLKQSSGISQ